MAAVLDCRRLGESAFTCKTGTVCHGCSRGGDMLGAGLYDACGVVVRDRYVIRSFRLLFGMMRYGTIRNG